MNYGAGSVRSTMANPTGRDASLTVDDNDDGDHERRLPTRRRPKELYGAGDTGRDREGERVEKVRLLTLDAFGCSEEVGEAGDGGNRRRWLDGDGEEKLRFR